jgi:hypothetical protein
MSEENTSNEVVLRGALQDSLDRNIKTIKADRAAEISEDGEIAYKRKVEDLRTSLNKLTRSRNRTLDLSPDNSLSLLTKNFNGEEFADSDMETSINIRNAEIAFQIGKERYKFLFGKEFV